tara:strand:- start:23216 stop:23362 length:147 start_codon:yes stop_codon:yes gene_type:complete
MSEENKNNPPKGRKVYEKPMITSDKVFETLALSCGSSGQACFGVPPKS